MDFTRCPACQQAVTPVDGKHSCEACGAWYHEVCWETAGGCSACGPQASPTTQSLEADESDSKHRSPLQGTHPRTYGQLLAASQRISDATGCGLMLLFFLLAACVCFLLHARALHGLFADPESQQLLDGLRSWWVYVIVIGAAIACWTKADDWLEGLAYRRERDDLVRGIANEGLDPYELIGLIEGDGGLDTIAKHLKSDRELQF